MRKFRLVEQYLLVLRVLGLGRSGSANDCVRSRVFVEVLSYACQDHANVLLRASPVGWLYSILGNDGSSAVANVIRALFRSPAPQRHPAR